MNPENAINKGPETPVEQVPKSPQELEAQFASKAVELDPKLIDQEQKEIDRILSNMKIGRAPEIEYGMQNQEISQKVDGVRLDAIREVTGKDISEAKSKARWVAGIGAGIGLSAGVFGGALATGTTILSGTALAIGAATAAAPVGAAVVGYGLYKWMKNRQVRTSEKKVQNRWGLDEYGFSRKA